MLLYHLEIPFGKISGDYWTQLISSNRLSQSKSKELKFLT